MSLNSEYLSADYDYEAVFEAAMDAASSAREAAFIAAREAYQVAIAAAHKTRNEAIEQRRALSKLITPTATDSAVRTAQEALRFNSEDYSYRCDLPPRTTHVAACDAVLIIDNKVTGYTKEKL